MRNVQWTHTANYSEMKRGHTFESEQEIKQLFDNGKLNESHVYIFKNNDIQTQRNTAMPLYEAVYWCQERNAWLIVQKSHLKQLYKNSEKTERGKMWNVNEQGLPYWVDRYAFCVKRIMESQSSSK